MKANTYNSKLSDLKMPFIIPKRGKGSAEVLALCNILGYGRYNSIDYMSYLSAYSKNICDKNLPGRIAQGLVHDYKLKKIDLDITFDYYLDRATPSFNPSFYELRCFYTASYNLKDTAISMGVKVPIRIQQAGFTGVGELTIEVTQPEYSFFEDILDDIQKNLDIKIYPLNCSADENIAQKVIDTGKTLKEYIVDINKVKVFRQMGTGGIIKIKARDVYNMYNLESEIIW